MDFFIGVQRCALIFELQKPFIKLNCDTTLSAVHSSR
ncbi:MAG: hypothetical protein ACI85F_002137, partial [Bacteroidia bacterium]